MTAALLVFGLLLGLVQSDAPAPRTAAPAPDAASPAPDAASPAPDAASPAPDAASPAPDAASPAPDAASPAPDAASPAPDAASPAPDAASPAPDAASPAPDAASPAPDAASPAPDVASPAPDAASPAPDAASPAPSKPGGTLVYTIPLPSELIAAPRVIELGGEAALLLALERGIEVRRVADGGRIWGRDDLAGDGLAAELYPREGGTGLAWSGETPDGPRLLLLALDDGSVLRAVPLPRPPIGPPLASGPGPTWHVPLEGARVARIPEDGSAVSEFELRTPIDPPLLAFGGRVLATDADDRRLRTVGASTRRATGRDVHPATAVVAASRLYAAGQRSFAAYDCRVRERGGQVHCDQDWRQRLGGAVVAPPLLARERLLVPSLDTHLYAFDPDNGHLRWRAQTGARLAHTPVPWGETAVALLPAVATRVLFLSPADGRPLGTVTAEEGDVLTGGLARADDLLLVGVRRYPEFTPALQAWRVELAPPPAAEPGAEPTEPAESADVEAAADPGANP